MGDSKDRPAGGEPQLANNPEGEMHDESGRAPSPSGLGVSGDEVHDAGRRATSDEPVSRGEVLDQAAYKDNSADVGQQAAHSEAEDEQNSST